ncbi:Translocon-associated protein subunit alpha [Nymphaea thermarum]|nr:Translocon-associated protein subunit alpha [Nymphaea thermarum]
MASDRLRLSCVLFFFISIIFSSAFLQVARCQADAETDGAEVPEGGDLGIVGDDIQDLSEVVYGPAPGVETMCIFPKNAARIVPAGEKAELLVGLNNGGEAPLKVQAISASLHLPFDHQLLVQNLTLQPGAFDLVGTIVYEVDEQQYSSVFYNGTIEVVEAGGFLSVESVFLVTLGIAITGLLGLWIYGQIQNLSKKTKRVKKVEVGTGTTDSDMDEWLKGTSFSQSLSQKSKKKK